MAGPNLSPGSQFAKIIGDAVRIGQPNRLKLRCIGRRHSGRATWARYGRMIYEAALEITGE